jgi:general secretion pathway protein E
MTKILNVQTVTEILLNDNIITLEQKEFILQNFELQKKKLVKERLSEVKSKRTKVAGYLEISTPEVITSLGIKIGEKGDILSEEIIMKAIARYVKLDYKKIDPLKLDVNKVTKIFPRAFAQKHIVIPLEVNPSSVTVAVTDPYNMEVLDSLRKVTSLKINMVISTKTDILKTISEFYGFRTSVVAAEKELSSSYDIQNLEQYVKIKDIADIESTDQHIINAVDYIFHYAFEQRASDIHIEPKRANDIIRIRIDGVLHNIHSVPKAVHNAIVSRIKTLSRMDIAEKRRPQDGRIKTDHKGREIELRVSTLPVAFGEKVVMRIFDPDILMQDLKELGFTEKGYQLFNSFIMQPHGIILVTGPTGSGKTTTLYSALRRIATEENNVTTIEDPIEMICEEFNQIAVQPSINFTFANALRTILRQDPDIIMVGEIRDLETAQNAIQSALTGHLVLSTLHTNDAPSSIARLIDMGVEPFLISSTVIGIMAQRLVRKICPHCLFERKMSDVEMAALKIKNDTKKDIMIKEGAGCVLCRKTGYLGRDGIFEILDINNDIKMLINKKADSSIIKSEARKKGMNTLRESAIKKLLAGITTVDEIIRVTSTI